MEPKLALLHDGTCMENSQEVEGENNESLIQ